MPFGTSLSHACLPGAGTESHHSLTMRTENDRGVVSDMSQGVLSKEGEVILGRP